MWYAVPGRTRPARPLLCLDDALLVQHSTVSNSQNRCLSDYVLKKKRKINEHVLTTDRVFEPGRLRLDDSLLLFPCLQQKQHPRW